MAIAPWPYVTLQTVANPVLTPLGNYMVPPDDTWFSAYAISWECLAQCILIGLSNLGFTQDVAGLTLALANRGLVNICYSGAPSSWNGSFLVMGPTTKIDLSTPSSVIANMVPGHDDSPLSYIAVADSVDIGNGTTDAFYDWNNNPGTSQMYLEYGQAPLDEGYTAPAGFVDGGNLTDIQVANLGFDGNSIGPNPVYSTADFYGAATAEIAVLGWGTGNIYPFKSLSDLSEWLFPTPSINYPRAEIMTPAQAIAQDIPLVIEWTAPVFGSIVYLQNYCFYVNLLGGK